MSLLVVPDDITIWSYLQPREILQSVAPLHKQCTIDWTTLLHFSLRDVVVRRCVGEMSMSSDRMRKWAERHHGSPPKFRSVVIREMKTARPTFKCYVSCAA